jgi:DNA-binding SARP family transcriptional activator/predicted ATPase
MAHLSLCLLGQLQVKLDGEAVLRFRGDTARALLAYLAVHPGTAFARAQLAALLWPDHPEDVALQNLRQALRRLRTAIGDAEADPPFLLATRATIAMHPEGDSSCDVTAFTEAVAASKAHGHRRLAECPACIGRLEEGVRLYRGEFLAGFSLDSALFEEWLVVEREHLHGQALEVLEALAAYHEGWGAYEQALGYARRQIEMEGWRESARRQAMRALALSGDRVGALAQYEACCRALAEELGIEPEAETRALYERIRDGAELRPLAAAPAHNLPAEITPFVGRKALLSEIVAHVQDPDCRLLTLVGPGGSGKTRLARQAARAFLTVGAGTPFDDGVFFVPLAPLRSSEGIVPTIASAIGFSFYSVIEGGEGGTPKQQLLDYLRQKQMLVILDNFEHLLAAPQSLPRHALRSQDRLPQGQSALPPSASEAASLVPDILHAASGVKILATSRARLNVRGEHLLSIEGMRHPETLPEDASELDQYSAVQLFLTSAREVCPDLQPTTDDLAHVVRICHLVEGMPLALLLAAAWMEMLTPAEIAHELESKAAQAIDFLATDWRDVPERQRSMRAVFDHSWDLLGERERAVFRALSVFRGGFTRGAAEQVAGASLRELMSLVSKSLLHRAPGGRYELHELPRQYAEEHLGQSPDAGDAVRDRYCAYYASALEAWGAELKGARQQAALAEMDLEVENARAAWDWTAAHVPEQVERLERSMDGLCTFYQARGRFQEGEAACQNVAARLEDGMSAPELRVQARALAWQGVFARLLGWMERSRRLAQQGLDRLGDLRAAGHDVRREEAFALWVRGVTEYGLGEREGARETWQESLALCQALGGRWEEANILQWLGWAAAHSGLYDEAEGLQRKSLDIRRALGDAMGMAGPLTALGMLAARTGRLEEGERLVRERIAICREIGDRVMVARGYHFLANVYKWKGEYAEVCSLEERALAIHDELGYHHGLLESHNGVGLAKRHLGAYREARAHYELSLAMARESGNQQFIAGDLDGLGKVGLAEEAYAEAVPLLQESLAIRRQTGMRPDEANTSVFLGCALRGLGDHRRAWDHICATLRIAAELPVVMFLSLDVVPAVALLLADRGEAARAVELYALASCYPQVANSRWHEDVVGRHIATAAETLPPEVVAAAQERGRGRDLEATVKELLAELEAQQGSDAR